MGVGLKAGFWLAGAPVTESHDTATVTPSGERKIAYWRAPMVGGMISATILTLLVIPVIYALWKGWSLKQEYAVTKGLVIGRPLRFVGKEQNSP